MDVNTTNCAVCVKRPRELGGNGLCPLLGYTYSERETQGDHSTPCPYFKVGDLRVKSKPVAQAALF